MVITWREQGELLLALRLEWNDKSWVVLVYNIYKMNRPSQDDMKAMQVMEYIEELEEENKKLKEKNKELKEKLEEADKYVVLQKIRNWVF